jgi:hypothetical protein
MTIGRFGLFGCPEHSFAELAESAQISVERTRQIVNTALCKLRWWAVLADITLIDLERTKRDIQRRRATGAAAHGRYLGGLHARAPEVWTWAEQAVMSRSRHDQAFAALRLRELREAAELAGALPAFEARLVELRASTSKRQALWDRWSDAERARLRGAEQPGHASRQDAGVRSRPLTVDNFRGWSGLQQTAIESLLREQPSTVLEALRIRNIGRSTTKRLLAAGLITDPEGVQQRGLTYEEMGLR